MNNAEDIRQFAKFVGNKFNYEPETLILEFFQSYAKFVVKSYTPILNKYFGEFKWSLVGSANLACRGLLPRTIKDLDIVTDQNYFDGFIENYGLDELRVNNQGDSGVFYIDGYPVKSFKIKIGKIGIDVFYTGKQVKTEIPIGMPVSVRMELESEVIKHKRSYIKNFDNSDEGDTYNRDKHQADLDYYDFGKLVESETK